MGRYHEDCLFVTMAAGADRLKSYRGRAAAAASSRGVASERIAAALPGADVTETADIDVSESALLGLMARGLVSGVEPLRRPAQVFAPLRMASAGPMDGAVAVAESVTGVQNAHVSDRVLSGRMLVRIADSKGIDSAHRALAKSSEIAAVERVPMRYLAARAPMPALAQPAVRPWHLERLGLEAAKKKAAYDASADVRVAVLDTGIDQGHPDLAGLIDDYSFAPPFASVQSGPLDINGHGTHVAGIVASNQNGGSVEGVSRARILAKKIFNDTPAFINLVKIGGDHAREFGFIVEPNMYIRALGEALDEDVDVVNLSIGGPAPPSSTEAELFAALVENNVAICAAMGNERDVFGNSPISYPAAIPGVLAVCATDPRDRFASFSNGGVHAFISAPGVQIWSTLPTYPGHQGYYEVQDPQTGGFRRQDIVRETDYDAWPGTSMASPIVAGACALWLAKNGGNRDLVAMKEDFIDTADVPAGMAGTPNFSPDYGHGIINIDRLI